MWQLIIIELFQIFTGHLPLSISNLWRTLRVFIEAGICNPWLLYNINRSQAVWTQDLLVERQRSTNTIFWHNSHGVEGTIHDLVEIYIGLFLVRQYLLTDHNVHPRRKLRNLDDTGCLLVSTEYIHEILVDFLGFDRLGYLEKGSLNTVFMRWDNDVGMSQVH